MRTHSAADDHESEDERPERSSEQHISKAVEAARGIKDTGPIDLEYLDPIREIPVIIWKFNVVHGWQKRCVLEERDGELQLGSQIH